MAHRSDGFDPGRWRGPPWRFKLIGQLPSHALVWTPSFGNLYSPWHNSLTPQ